MATLETEPFMKMISVQEMMRVNYYEMWTLDRGLKHERFLPRDQPLTE
jgi:hypothetical protein